MTTIFAKLALLEDGWASDVRFVLADGCIAALEAGGRADVADEHAAIVIPGLVNAHSHAFQRMLAGHTEERGPRDRDNFWTWRSRMYALAGQISAERLHVIARQAYTEMVATGFTSVAEFHYLHRQPGADVPGDEMAAALVAAARDSGIRLTYVPVHYERAGFMEPAPTKNQEQFAQSCDDFLAHYARQRANATDDTNVALGVHSLRAVTADSVRQIAAVAARDGVPMHVHVAEQQREVDQCLAAYGARPVAWLAEHFELDANWCLVHATHIDDQEIAAIAKSGAVVCLCPSTEANLGDGLFPLAAYLEQGGRIAIGSDSHVSINPFEELRWLEYGQRLISQSRKVAAIRRQQTGRNLFELALTGGALASAKAGSHLAVGAVADLVVLDDDSPMLAGHSTRSLLDALVFSGFTLPIDKVMVGGRWYVEDGRHVGGEAARQAFAEVAADLEFGSDV